MLEYMFLYFQLEFDLFDNIRRYYYEMHLNKLHSQKYSQVRLYLPAIDIHNAKYPTRAIIIFENNSMTFFFICFPSASYLRILIEINR